VPQEEKLLEAHSYLLGIVQILLNEMPEQWQLQLTEACTATANSHISFRLEKEGRAPTTVYYLNPREFMTLPYKIRVRLLRRLLEYYLIEHPEHSLPARADQLFFPVIAQFPTEAAEVEALARYAISETLLNKESLSAFEQFKDLFATLVDVDMRKELPREFIYDNGMSKFWLVMEVLEAVTLRQVRFLPLPSLYLMYLQDLKASVLLDYVRFALQSTKETGDYPFRYRLFFKVRIHYRAFKEGADSDDAAHRTASELARVLGSEQFREVLTTMADKVVQQTVRKVQQTQEDWEVIRNLCRVGYVLRGGG